MDMNSFSSSMSAHDNMPHGHTLVRCLRPVADARAWWQVYLVGDPVQLPATVMSSRAVEHGYERSMFQRLQMAGHPVQVFSPPRFRFCGLCAVEHVP